MRGPLWPTSYHAAACRRKGKAWGEGRWDSGMEGRWDGGSVSRSLPLSVSPSLRLSVSRPWPRGRPKVSHLAENSSVWGTLRSKGRTKCLVSFRLPAFGSRLFALDPRPSTLVPRPLSLVSRLSSFAFRLPTVPCPLSPVPSPVPVPYSLSPIQLECPFIEVGSSTINRGFTVEAKKRSLIVIFLTVFIDLLGFGIVLPLLPRYAKSLHASPLALGLLMSSFSGMQFLFSPIWGRLSDRIGRRPVLLIGLLSSAAFYCLFGVATLRGSLTLLFLSRIGAGIAGATIATAQAFIADSTTDQERGKGMALIGAAFGVGFTFGPLLGSIWVSGEVGAGPNPAPGFVASALSFAAFCFGAAVLPESLRPGTRRAEASWMHWKSLQTALAVPTIGILILTFFVSTFAFANFESTLALLTATKGFEFSDRGNFFLFAYIGFVLSLAQGLLVRRLMPVVGESTMASAGSLLMVAGLIGIGGAALIASPAALLGLLPLAVVGFACLTPSLQSLISRRTSAAIQGEVLGVVQSTASLARILGPICGNLLLGMGARHAGAELSTASPPSAAPYVFSAGVMSIAFLLSLVSARAGEAAAS
jgi:DHA1 family tetracycline resistance protein-like MFS transporter